MTTSNKKNRLRLRELILATANTVISKTVTNSGIILDSVKASTSPSVVQSNRESYRLSATKIMQVGTKTQWEKIFLPPPDNTGDGCQTQLWGGDPRDLHNS